MVVARVALRVPAYVLVSGSGGARGLYRSVGSINEQRRVTCDRIPDVTRLLVLTRVVVEETAGFVLLDTCYHLDVEVEGFLRELAGVLLVQHRSSKLAPVWSRRGSEGRAVRQGERLHIFQPHWSCEWLGRSTLPVGTRSLDSPQSTSASLSPPLIRANSMDTFEIGITSLGVVSSAENGEQGISPSNRPMAPTPRPVT